MSSQMTLQTSETPAYNFTYVTRESVRESHKRDFLLVNSHSPLQSSARPFKFSQTWDKYPAVVSGRTFTWSALASWFSCDISWLANPARDKTIFAQILHTSSDWISPGIESTSPFLKVFSTSSVKPFWPQNECNNEKIASSNHTYPHPLFPNFTLISRVSILSLKRFLKIPWVCVWGAYQELILIRRCSGLFQRLLLVFSAKFPSLDLVLNEDNIIINIERRKIKNIIITIWRRIWRRK